MILLTKDEIACEIEIFLTKHPECQWDSTMAFEAIAIAQIEKMFDWVECNSEHHYVAQCGSFCECVYADEWLNIRQETGK